MSAIWLAGCSTGGAIVGGIVGTTAVGGRTPTTEINQIYYLGVFDPLGQFDPAVYRVRVHGQASMLSSVQFASGWVPAHMVDSLNSRVTFNDDGVPEYKQAGQTSGIASARRMMLFGPEGVLESPSDHRLVIVMGSSPEAFFSAVDETLGTVSRAQQELREAALNKDLFAALIEIKAESEELNRLARAVETDKQTLKSARDIHAAKTEKPAPVPAPGS